MIPSLESYSSQKTGEGWVTDLSDAASSSEISPTRAM
jgi:hypothetical protein